MFIPKPVPEQYSGSGSEIQIVRFVGLLFNVCPSNSQRQLLSQMADATHVNQQIAFFRSQIHKRSFDDETVRILESILVSKGLKSLIGVRSSLKQFMRSESVSIIREIAEETAERKLICADFLIRVLALIGDTESCLALRYEALVMREQKTKTHPGLQVSSEEWQTLAEHLIQNGFYSVANKVCDKALVCLKTYRAVDSKADEFLQDVHAIKKIKGLKDAAILSMSAQSVQTKAAEYLKQKTVEESTQHPITSLGTHCSGSSRFRSGIRKRNFHRLKQLQSL
ncbi:protein DOUBLE-STRAND BREAK FORMATION [Henckelia pumila]|uniref:protein DOUBLE-STRAND BREAK FORMATION n=1 Tax=Henckelia pumila TaxID=405737 RepID=UPI003C6E3DC4